MINFKPKQVTKKIISEMGERPRDVLSQRFGIGDSTEKKTLEAIGKAYGITRERVRQIENFAIREAKESKSFQAMGDVFAELKKAIEEKGGIIKEIDLLNHFTDDEHAQNHLYFLLVLGDDFTRLKEDEEFHHRWTIDAQKAEKVHDALRQLHKTIGSEDLHPEPEMLNQLRAFSESVLGEGLDGDEMLKLWLNLSKIVNKNALGEWGHAYSPNIKPRGMTDYAYLLLKKEGSPMRFDEIASKIKEAFGRKSHPATVHNGLIKDDRFVLVGRGLYALKEWGYNTGTVRDVIKNILQSGGPQTKDEIIKKVLKERYVKENTILVNLQNRKYFKKNAEGKYALAR